MNRILVLPLPFVLWGLGCFAFGLGRIEHVVVAVVALALACSGARTKRLFLGLYPMALLGLVYDAMRWVKDVGLTPARVHVCDLRALDMQLYAVTMPDGTKGTVHDWVQAHPQLALDAFFAVPYGTYIYVAIAFAVVLYRRDYERMQKFGWAFLVVNLAGFVTYHLYPAAPPWYFHAHGCAVDLASRSSAGANLTRVDALLGTPYFHGFYARASDVFGAVPSLHVTYPLLIVLFGWPVLGRLGKGFTTVFLVWMCAGAVYLDHHWVIDVLLGLLYAALTYLAVVSVTRMRVNARASVPVPARQAAP